MKEVTIRPGEVERVELTKEAAGLVPASGIKEAGVDIVHDGAPGVLIGQLTNVDDSGDYSFEVPIRDPSAMDMDMQGVYPWTLENERSTTVYLKNTTDKDVVAYPTFALPDGSFYTPPLINLKPYQTFAIDVRTLRNAKTPDNTGKVFPAGATHGQFVWRQETPYSIVGRAETVSLNDGFASSFTCGSHGCCDNYDKEYYFVPVSYTGSVGTNISIGTFSRGTDCDGYQFEDYLASTPYPSTSNSSIAYWNGSGTATLVGAGSATLSGGFYYANYDWHEYSETCSLDSWSWIAPVAPAQVTVAPAISGPNTVWYFNGQNPSGYATSITLTSNGGSSTTWTVTAGSNKVNLSASSGAQIDVTSSGTAFSASVGDISIKATVNGVDSAPFSLTSRTPYRLFAGAVETSCDATWGYTTLLYYQIQDNLLATLPSSIGFNEDWTTSVIADYQGTNWERGNPGGETTSNSAFADTIDGEEANRTPVASCTGASTAVQHWGQAWRVGSTTPGNGKLVQTNTLQKYINRAAHTSITSPAP